MFAGELGEACLSAQIHNEVTPPMQGHVLNSCQLRQPTMVVGTWQLGRREGKNPQGLTDCISKTLV